MAALLPITHIFTRTDARKIDEATVRALVESIREVGIINPLRVRPARRHVNGVEADAFEVTAGAHRLRAARTIGLESVPCVVVADDDLRAELAMIDENLCRAELTPAQRAEQTARRKAIYEEIHPEAKHGGDRKSDQVANSATCSFAAATASATGKSARTVRQDAERGEKVCEDALRLVTGTHLDTGAYLDKLKALPDADAQLAKVRRDLAAQKPRKPVPPASAPLNDFETEQKWRADLFRVWNRGSAAWREAVQPDLYPDAPVMDARFGESAMN